MLHDHLKYLFTPSNGSSFTIYLSPAELWLSVLDIFDQLIVNLTQILIILFQYH